MITSKRLLVAALTSATAIAIAGCASSSSGGSSTPSPHDASSGAYHWGVDAELSGPISYYGASIANGVAAYVSSVNATGGINGHKIVLTKLDNAGNPSQSSADATELITTDSVDAIFGQTLNTSCDAAEPVVARYQVPMACFSVGIQNPYVFNLGYDNALAGDAMIESAQKITGKSGLSIALMYPTTLTPTELAKSIQAAAPAKGVTIATAQSYNLTATDLSVQIARVVAAKPAAVLFSGTGPSLVSLVKGIRAAGLRAPVVWVDGTGNIGFLATSTDQGIYALNDYEYIPSAGATGAAAQFITAMGTSLGKDPTAPVINGGEAVDGYITAAAFGQALKSCGYPCSGAQLDGAVEKVSLSLDGLEPSFAYTAANHYPYLNWYLYHVTGPAATLLGTYPMSSS